MSDYYVYILSSLPALNFGHKAPLSYRSLLALCENLLDEKEISVLSGLSAWDRVTPLSVADRLLESFRSFEVSLRNELARLRAQRRHKDASVYLRPETAWDPWAIHVATNALRHPALDAERMLDEERWKKLDELSLGHFFDLDALISYALKLLILERWDMIASADKEGLLEEALQ